MSRRVRKAQETRRRLLEAAKEQMAHGGAESITIALITERADIGQGTFYNYFGSRDEIIDAVIYDVVETLGQRLDAMTEGMSDAAEVYSYSLRHLMHTAISDPVWGWFMVRLGIAQEGLLNALGPRASRDLKKGIDSGRFTIPDLKLASAMTFGSLLAAMQSVLNGEGKEDPSARYAEYLLRMVGIPQDEAHEIANRPLPALPDLVDLED
jgi:AcrR family transcriptional regulator